MLFELIILAGACRGPACVVERPRLERRIQKTTIVKVEKEVTKERRLRRVIFVR